MPDSPDRLIGLMAGAGPRLASGLLGILKAGGAFVPLHPAQPEERLRFVVRDCGLAVVVTESRHLELALRVAGGAGCVRHVVCLDEPAEVPPLPAGVELRTLDPAGTGEAPAPRAAPPQAPQPPASLAWVIYTSGSTGQPKGVAISHASAVAMLRWSRGWFGLGGHTRVVQSLSYAFDFGAWEILSTLVAGGVLHALAPEEQGDAAAWARRALAERADTVHATPSFFRAVAETGVRLEDLRILHLGGEALTRGQVERMAGAVAESCAVYNGYGPTEATVNSLIFATGRPGALRGGELVPIGRPSAENAAWVVSRRGELQPPGVPGELWLGGPGLARCYLGRPDLTAAKLVPDHLGGDPGGRLYRTGDLVRWLPEGVMEFLGRVDDQVKIRGFRVEPGEVEAALRRHPALRDAAVVAREVAGRGPALVAYVVGEEAPASGELRAFLRGALPEPMVPSFFVRLAGLPVTATGKVDRKALPDPHPEDAADGAPEAPRTPLEELLAEIWAGVLGRERVGVHESFFEIGGHSLLATRVTAQLRSLLGIELPVRTLFQAPTVTALAREVEALLRPGLAPAPPIVPVPRGGDLVLSYGQERLWFLDQLEPGSAAYNMTSAARLRGALDAAALERALCAIVRRHESLRTLFAAVDGRPVQRIEPPGAAAGLPRIDLTALPAAEREAEARRLVRQAARRPFDLARGPLARFALLTLGAREHALIAELHHIVADGWSTGVLLRELAALYRDPAGAGLPGLPVQYADYAAWQRSWLCGEALESRLAFWRGELEGAPAALELPADRPRPPVPTHRGVQAGIRLPGELTAVLRGLARSGGATLFMALLAGFQALLARVSGQPELLVGTPVAGRERTEIEGLIGFFVNTLVVRGDLRGEPAFGELLGRVRERSLAAFSHQEVPFEKLVEELAPERDLSRGPLVQVLFALQNMPFRLDLPGLAMSPMEVDHGTAKFDLSLLLVEEGEELAGWLEASADLFEEATVERLAGQLQALLYVAAAGPDGRFVDLPLLAEGERRQVLGRAPLSPVEPAAGGGGGGPVDEVLANVFAELLGLDEVGRHAGFFDLGGHSLLAARLTARVRQALGVELPLSAIFQSPTVAGLARRVEEALAGGGVDRPGPIPRVRRDSPLPASFAQERLWFLDQLEPGRPTYHMPAAVRLRGPLDAAALAGALSGVVRRHEALRTVFAATADGPLQVILPAAPVPLPEVDLAALPEEDRETESHRIAESEARRPFDLAAGPLLRAGLVRMGMDDHLLLFNLHHVAGDGGSMAVLLREAGALYAAPETVLPPLLVQYADFAVWQRERLRGARLEALLAFWRERLAGAPPALELPADRQRPAEPTGRGGTVPFALSLEASRGLAALARRQGATRFMVLLAGLDALLARLSGQTDLVVGVPVAGRTRIETEELIGLFVNTLPLRVACGLTAGDLLARVRTAVLGAHAHQELPFERLVEELRPERDLARSPLFQVMLAPRGADLVFDLPGIAAETIPVDTGTSRFDLTFLVGEETPVAGLLEHSADLFDAATASRLAGWWRTLLAGLAEAGETARLSDLPLLDGAERAQLLAAGDGGPLPLWEEGACLHELFARQAAATPAAVALIHGERRVTYGELAARAARLAEHLRGLGAGPEVPVGVCAPRTPDLIAALLGVMAAGGCSLPLDPAYPPERLALMLEDAGAPVVLAAESVRDRLPAGPARHVLLEEVADEGPAGLPGGAALPGNLAYLIYTSGSTGRPKGVAIEHRSAVALVRWARGLFTADELAGVLASTSVCFDLSVFEIFVPLALGGRIVLAENALELPALPAASEVALVNTVPSALSALLRAGGLPRSVRTVNLAGEPLPRSLVRAAQAGGVERVLDLYGPSEDTTYSTGAVIDPAAEGAPEIGRPIAGTRASVLDADGGLLPAGAPGELYLGGAGLARGYLGRPALTAERFVPDPFSGEPGARLYRTGDLVRWRPDGALDFLGRIDHQVKVRGFRIELGEIEDALAQHPLVRQAAVVALGAGEERRLVAYVAAGDGSAETARHASEALDTHLSGRLPAYMVPGAIVVLDALPLSPNGKVDRRALPAPGEPSRAPAAFVPPRTPTEEAVAAIWAEALGVAQVGLGQSFFDLGGHSLKAAAVAARIRDRFGLSLPLRELFVAATVEGVAARIEEELVARASDERIDELLALLDAEEEIAGMS